MFVSHQHAQAFLRAAGGFAWAGGCGNAASPGYFFMINGVAGLCCSRARAAEVAALKQRLQELELAA